MNRFEFEKVMDAVGLYNRHTEVGRLCDDEEVCYWNNLKIWFGNRYFTQVGGCIPLEVANAIYTKYPDNQYGIRVEGGCVDWNPNEWATDWIFEKEVQNYLLENLSGKDYEKKCQNARRNLMRRKIDNKYISSYHIDTKEGLLTFILEMKDYYLRKSNMPETEVKKYDSIMAKVTTNILKAINPTISAYNWMQGAEEQKDIYNATIEESNKTELGKLFREVISKFDQTVNPYENQDIELDKPSNYLRNVKIGADSFRITNGKKRNESCQLTITDLNTGNSTAYYREPSSFSYQLMYTLDDEHYLNVLHYYSEKDDNGLGKGEIIAIDYFGKNAKEKIDLRLNLTTGKAGPTYGPKGNATKEQIAFVYDELLKAIEYASSITIENMKKNQNTKKLSGSKQDKC